MTTPKETVSVTVPSKLKYCHYVSDASELLFKSKINFYSEELFNLFTQDMRIVMYELFSNAVNHSQSDCVTIVLSVDEDELSVTIKTKNNPFVIKQVNSYINEKREYPLIVPPFSNEILGSDFVVYRDYEYDIYCRVTGPFDVYFRIEKNISREKHEFDIPEHYGLSLITKLTHYTGYYRSPDRYDNFTIKKRIK